ncbi:MAG: sulfotransferase [Aphanothece sp. CMT-3BRIN-NPC111]|jgi:LPS sulfotransferase NodH|nr:sulfotransferase [Aphanothece sp. CMT-3BRIN-NPC111]
MIDNSVLKNKKIYKHIEYLFKKTELISKKFVIITQGRTGSTLLCDLINSHPDIHCDGEIFQVFASEILDVKLYAKVIYIINNNHRAYGFKVLPYQLIQEGINPRLFLCYIHKNNWNIIYLKRHNLFRHTVSLMIAQKRNTWQDTSNNPLNNYRYYLDTSQIIALMKDKEIKLEEEKKYLNELPYLSLTYEDDLLKAEQHQNTANKVFNYLEFSSVPVKTEFCRTTSDRLSDFIENYEEVVKAVSQTKYAHFLET